MGAIYYSARHLLRICWSTFYGLLSNAFEFCPGLPTWGHAQKERKEMNWEFMRIFIFHILFKAVYSS